VIIITSLHTKKYPVATIIHRIDSEELLILLLKFSEIKFTKPASGFDNPGEGYSFNKVGYHGYCFFMTKFPAIFMLTSVKWTW
jgi:hypothetical protein